MSKTYFLDLKLFDQQHHIVEQQFLCSFYTKRFSLDEKKSTWYITPQTQYADLTLLEQLADSKIANK